MKCSHILQSFRKEEKLCNLILLKWDVVTEILNCLKIIYQATIAMQKEDFKLSDFYTSYIYMESKLNKCLKKQNITKLAEYLLDMLGKRKTQLIENSTMTSALALDPRFCSELNSTQIQIAIDNLANLWQRLRSLKTHDLCEETATINLNDTASSDEDITISNTTILKEYLKRQNTEQSLCQVPTADSFDIREAIRSFCMKKHELEEGTILDFWNGKKDMYPELYKLAEVILAISPTQAMVETSFSTLSYVFNKLRNQLSSQLLEDILCIALNEDLLFAVNKEDLDQLTNENEIKHKNT